jgi:hypothetical protein
MDMPLADNKGTNLKNVYQGHWRLNNRIRALFVSQHTGSWCCAEGLQLSVRMTSIEGMPARKLMLRLYLHRLHYQNSERTSTG